MRKIPVSKKTKAFIILWIIFGFFMIATQISVMPIISEKANAWLRKESLKWTDIQLEKGELEISLFPLRVKYNDFRINIKNRKMGFKKIEGENILVSLPIFALFWGSTDFIVVEGNNLKAFADIDPWLEGKGPPEKLPMDNLFYWLHRLPLKKITLEKTSLDLRWVDKKTTYKIQSDKTELEQFAGISVELKSQLQSDLGVFDNLQDFKTELSLKITATDGKINYLNVKYQELALELSGSVKSVSEVLLKPNLDLQGSLSFEGASAAILLGKLTHKKDLKIRGQGQLDFSVQTKSKQDWKIPFNFKSSDLGFKKMNFGSVITHGEVKPDLVKIEDLLWDSLAGKVSGKSAEIQLSDGNDWKIHLSSANWNLQDFFRNMSLRIPVWTEIAADLPCQGKITPFEVKCDGQLHGKNLIVRGGVSETENVFVRIPVIDVKGNVKVTNQDVVYDTELKIGPSNGQSKARISFKDGFAIKFKATELYPGTIPELLGMKWNGKFILDGETNGDSDAATFAINLKSEDTQVDGFNLGQAETKLSYLSGSVFFKEFKAKLAQSLIEGDFLLNFRNKTWDGKFWSDLLQASDVQPMIENKFSNIFLKELTGIGKMTAQISGPFDLWKTNAILNADVHNGKWFSDRFDHLHLKVVATDGNWNVAEAIIRKNTSILSTHGILQNNRNISFAVDLADFRLEDSETLAKLPSLSGSLKAHSEISGTIDNPKMDLEANLNQFVLDEYEMPPSQVFLKLQDKILSGRLSLLGGQIHGLFNWPQSYEKDVRIQFDTTKLNFARFTSLLGGRNLQNQFQSELTSRFDLEIPGGRWNSAKGNLFIPQFYLQRDGDYLKNPRPLSVQIKNGAVQIDDFYLAGSNNDFVEIKGPPFTIEDLNVNLKAKTNLHLFHILVPFLEDIGGPFEISSQFLGSLQKPHILGTATLKQDFFKLKGFPHPIEKIQGDVTFSQARIILQNLKASVASGIMTGDGSVQIEGLTDYPTEIKLHGEGLKLLFPDKVKSQGFADLVFSGRWFPFLLSGTYHVQNAFVDMELGEGDGTKSKKLKTISYLPKFLQQSQTEPIALDIMVILDEKAVVKNSLFDGAVMGQLQVKGTPSQIVLLGKLTTEKGSKILFKDKPFDLSTGILRFDDPQEINPDLYLSGQARVEQYDVNVVIQGPALSPSIILSSTPPLSNQDIISLLALGVTSNQNAQNNVGTSNQGAQAGAEALGLGISKSGLQKGVKNAFGVNVQITSSYDSTKNISVPKVSLQKPLRKNLNLIFSKPLNSDIAQEFKLQYQINKEVSTVGSYEERDNTNSTATKTTEQNKTSILGLDLEYKREFK